LKSSAISVTLAADGLQFYLNGIFQPKNNNINHRVVLAGYDPMNQYKIKNSWGIRWGIAGYGYLSR
jgi:C1A family cysteine protease